MLRTLLYLTAILIILTTMSYAKVEISIAPEIGMMGGYTEYELDITANYIDDTTFASPTNITWRLTSLLEYPLDATVGGLTILIKPVQDVTAWSLSGSFTTNLTDPTDKMIDSDWEGASPIFNYTKFSYTESNVEMNMYKAKLEGSFRFIDKQKFVVSWYGGLWYQKIEQSMKGIRGWQIGNYNDLDPSNDTTFIFNSDIYDNTEVLYYKVTYINFIGGVKAEYELNRNFYSEAKAGFTRVRYDDVDDHPLRNKLSTSDGFGNGFTGSFDFTYKFNSNSQAHKPFMKLSGTYVTFNASGPQTQEWYGDDAGTPGDDTGLIFELIPHTVRSRQYNINFQLGVSF